MATSSNLYLIDCDEYDIFTPMYNENDKKYILSIIILSILGHVFLYSTIIMLPKSFVERFEQTDDSPDRIEINQISREQLQKYRTVGIKKGSKDFSVPMASNKPIALPGAKQKPNISLEALSFNMDKNDIKKLGKKIKKSDEKVQKDGIPVGKYKKQKDKIKRERTINKMIKREMLRSQVPSYDHSLIKNTDINMHFTPPEGVDESELNDVEKKHYGFHKRSYQVYVNSFLKTYHKAISQRPYIQKLFFSQSDDLTGRVTFDSKGNLVSIKMMKWADNDEIQKIFEMTLAGIKALRNPPVEFIQKDGEFSIYYTLKFSN
ncbi:MAG: hypothetical protein KAG61_06210 [Bacteriovoracaceae bacterium]|nr:hypothetical protein [Bacteriovoracaceae bacterium]